MGLGVSRKWVLVIFGWMNGIGKLGILREDEVREVGRL